MFYVDFPFKIEGVAQLHELVGVAGITVFTAEFAASIRIYSPAKRHVLAFGQILTCFKLEVFDETLRFQDRALSGKASNRPLPIFALRSPFVKHNSIVSFAPRNMFTIKEFQEGDGVFPGDADPSLEVGYGEFCSDSRS